MSNVPDTRAESEPRWRIYACLGLLLIGLHLVIGPRIELSKWVVTPEGNAALAEALQWRQGILSLPSDRPVFETAAHDGKQYNVVGLAFVLLSVIGTSLTDWIGNSALAFSPALYVAFVALPLPFVAYWAFRQTTDSAPWAAVLAAHLLAATPLLGVMYTSRGGCVYTINHLLAVSGLLVFAGDLLGKCRLWPAVLGLGLAVWSRQMTCFFAVPLLWIAWQRGCPAKTDHSDSRHKRGGFLLVVAGLAAIAAVPMTLNTMKFGSPFDTGYPRLYEGRTDMIGIRGATTFMSIGYIPEHLQAMNTAFPQWDIRKGTLYPDLTETNGGSIWLTSPLLLGLFFWWRSWWTDRYRRALVLGSILVMLGVMCYHTTGSEGYGYYRYALDFIPIWLLVLSPLTTSLRGQRFAIGCLAYSALYFNVLRFY